MESQDYDDFDDDGAGFSDNRSQETLKVILSDLLGRWHWIALFVILGTLGAVYYISKVPKIYQASTTLLIKEQVNSVMSRGQAEEINMGSLEAMNTVAARIVRFDLLERVASRKDIRELPGLVPEPIEWLPQPIMKAMGKEILTADSAPSAPPPPAALAGMIGSWLDVNIRRNTRLLDISITHPNPEVTKAIADAIALEYLNEISSDRIEGRGSSIDILQKQSDEARKNLQTAGGSLAIYSRALDVHKNLDLKEAEVNTLSQRYLSKHPKLIAAIAELDSLKQQFLSEYEVAKRALNEKQYWETAAATMPDPTQDAEGYFRIARQQLLARIGVLESEIQSSTSVFNSMLTRIEESMVDQESDETSANISNLARVPGAPVGPDAKKSYAMGAFGGLAAGVLLALILSKIDNKFHTVSQFAGETNQVILASISEISTRHLAIAERDYYKKHPEEQERAPKLWDERVLFRPGVSSTNYAEMFRVLRASVTLLGDERKRKITLFSSALPSEGKTLTSVNFALAAAGQGRKTLLIDLDLRKPAVHKVFGLHREQKQHTGITECLANQTPLKEAIIRETGVDNLHMVLSGKRAPNPGELLSTDRLNTILTEACAEYDVVVLDTAPLLAVPDTRIVAPLADNFCLVCRAEYVPKGAVRHVLNTLEEDGTALSGVVFNGFKEKRRLIGQNNSYGYYKTSRYGKAYQYGYGAYGSYGSRDDD